MNWLGETLVRVANDLELAAAFTGLLVAENQNP
jgi:hypothetical protein